jgi:hypothetical protein
MISICLIVHCIWFDDFKQGDIGDPGLPGYNVSFKLFISIATALWSLFYSSMKASYKNKSFLSFIRSFCSWRLWLSNAIFIRHLLTCKHAKQHLDEFRDQIQPLLYNQTHSMLGVDRLLHTFHRSILMILFTHCLFNFYMQTLWINSELRHTFIHGHFTS